jgi:hypothetical protein
MSTTIQREMVKIKKTIKPKREEYLRGTHRRLRKAAKTAFGPEHGRFDFYDYLDLVLKTYWSWERRRIPKRLGRQFGALFGVSPRKGRTPLHYLVGATSHGDEPMHSAAAKKIETRDSRWVNGLRYAAKHRAAVQKKGLREFCGGIAGCADEFYFEQSGKSSKSRRNRLAKTTKIPRGMLVARSPEV